MVVIQIWLPIFEIILSVVQNLTCLGTVTVGVAYLSRNHGTVVKQLKKATTVTGEDNLFLGSLDCGQEFGVICLFEFFPRLCEKY